MAQDRKGKFSFEKIAQKIKENERVQELARKTREALDSEREAEAIDREIEREMREAERNSSEYEENSENTGSASRNTRSILERIQSISRKNRSTQEMDESVSRDTRSIRESGQSVSRNTQSIRESGQSVSRNTQSIRENGQSVSRDTRSIRENGRSVSGNTQSISEKNRSASGNTRAVSGDTMIFKRGESKLSRDTGTINREDIPKPKPVKKLKELEELERKALQAAEDARKETVSLKREAIKAAQREMNRLEPQQRRTGSYTRDELRAAEAQQRRTGSYTRDELRAAEAQQRRTGSYTRDELRAAEAQQRRTGSYTRDELRAAESNQRRTGTYTKEELKAAGAPPKPVSPFGSEQSQRANAATPSKSKKKKIKIGNKKRFAAAILIVIAIIAIIAAIAISCSSGHDKSKQETTTQTEKEQILSEASTMAAMYDYDGAIKLLKTASDYENDEDITNAITAYETTKSTMVEYPVDQVTHVFFHALLVEPEVSFSETSQMVDGFNIYMTTLDEFNDIIQSMYDKGYVLVSLYDVAKAGADGTFEAGKIMLPEGKKAFVLSEDDVCYYHAYENGGIADKLLIDEETGKVKAQYTYQDGTVEVGDFDVLPALDTFVEEHPDFSYHGAKGILALTGYNGILGYRTDTTYDDESPDAADRDSHEQAWLDAHPDFDYDKECEEAKKVAEAIKADGWYFASHSWGHKWQSSLGIESFTEDTNKWLNRVKPLIGDTDIWIYSNGEDVDTTQYQDRFKVLQDNGFKYFCTVNSNQYSTRIDSYGLNQGRRNLDGYRMYYDMINDDVDKLSDLFDVNAVFDKRRPTPVPEI